VKSTTCLFVCWCLTPLSTIFQLYRGENRRTTENLRPVASHWQTLSHNVVHLALIEIPTHNISVTYHLFFWLPLSVIKRFTDHLLFWLPLSVIKRFTDHLLFWLPLSVIKRFTDHLLFWLPLSVIKRFTDHLFFFWLPLSIIKRFTDHLLFFWLPLSIIKSFTCYSYYNRLS
jgi:hypothetical protein